MAVEAEPLTSGESDFLNQLCGFARRKAQNGVYMNALVSKDGERVVAIIAIGEQAAALQRLVLSAQVPTSGIEIVESLDTAGLEQRW